MTENAILSQSYGSPLGVAVSGQRIFWTDLGNKTVNMLVR